MKSESSTIEHLARLGRIGLVLAATLGLAGCGEGHDGTTWPGADVGATGDGAGDEPQSLEEALPGFSAQHYPVDLAWYEGLEVGVTQEGDAYLQGIAGKMVNYLTTFGVYEGKCFIKLAEFDAFFVDTSTSCYEGSVTTSYDCSVRDGYYLDLTVIDSSVVNEIYEQFGDESQRIYPAQIGATATMLIGLDDDGGTTLYPLAAGLYDTWDNVCYE